ncbi:MAG TPA: CheR family methyltransferase [Pseudomonadales bacterium]|nr:CheR family methyltransferase [Pseudomonadales bacterium]
MISAQNSEPLRAFLEYDLGLDLSNVRLDDIVDAVHRTGETFDSFETFASIVASSIAVHETYFLRHREQFDWIESVWLPFVIENHTGGEPVRILSGGCATGEEPYSLYAHLSPRLQRAGIELEVDAVDVSQPALDRARQGRYGLWSLRGVVMESEESWLAVGSRTVRVLDWVKQGVLFRQQNLMRAMPQDRIYDLILCRNVMIYMHPLAITRTLCNLSSILKPGGFIMPGPSDPNPPDTLLLDVCWNRGCRVFMHKHHKPALLSIDKYDDEKSPLKESPPKKSSVIQQPALQKSTQVWTEYTQIESMIRDGHYDTARSLLEENTQRNPMDVRSYIMLGMLALDLDDLACAEQAARKAAYIEPDSLFTVYLIANVKYQAGDKDAAHCEFMWIWQHLKKMQPGESVKYCEDITVEQFREVIHARLF